MAQNLIPDRAFELSVVITLDHMGKPTGVLLGGRRVENVRNGIALAAPEMEPMNNVEVFEWLAESVKLCGIGAMKNGIRSG